jgi:hypothetical protein
VAKPSVLRQVLTAGLTCITQSKRAGWEHNLVCGFNMDARAAAVVRDQVLSGRGEIGRDLDASVV